MSITNSGMLLDHFFHNANPSAVSNRIDTSISDVNIGTHLGVTSFYSDHQATNMKILASDGNFHGIDHPAHRPIGIHGKRHHTSFESFGFRKWLFNPLGPTRYDDAYYDESKADGLVLTYERKFKPLSQTNPKELVFHATTLEGFLNKCREKYSFGVKKGESLAAELGDANAHIECVANQIERGDPRGSPWMRFIGWLAARGIAFPGFPRKQPLSEADQL